MLRSWYGSPLTRCRSRVYSPRMCGSKRLSRWLMAVLMVSLAGPASRAQRHERKRVERAEISALEQQWRQAQLSEDIPEMDHLLSDDFLGITAAGEVVTKAQQLDRMRSRELALTRLDISDTKVKISGSLAVVTSLAQLDGTAHGAPMRGFFRYTQVYQREPGDGWKITNFEATRVPNGAGVYGTGANAPQASSGAHPASVPSSSPASPAGSGSPPPQS